jgi:hypothetical protein
LSNDSGLVITEETVCLYFVDMEQRDWLCQLSGTGDFGLYSIDYRIRFKDPENPNASPFLDKDRKSFWHAEANCARDFIIEKMDLMYQTMIAIGKSDCHGKVTMGAGGVDQFIRDLKAQPWAHTQTVQ